MAAEIVRVDGESAYVLHGYAYKETSLLVEAFTAGFGRLALVAKVSPPRYLGIMMGGWFVATAIGNKLTMIGVFWTEWLHSTFWAVLAGLAFAIAVVLLLLLRPLKRAMPGV